MQIKNFFSNYKSISLFLGIFFVQFLITFCDLNAGKVNGPERIRSCDDKGVMSKFANTNDPVDAFREMEIDLSNPSCLGLVLSSYAMVKTSIAAINWNCNQSIATSPAPSVAEDVKIFWNAKKRASVPNCRNSLATFPASVVGSFVVLGSVLAHAKDEFESVQVCGHDWYAPNPKDKNNSSEGSYQAKVKNEINTNKNLSYDSSKEYREWFHKGKEFEDRPPWGDEWCKHPQTNNAQKYYLRGLQKGDFLCEQYNPSFVAQDQRDKYLQAYNCCLKRRKEFICLEKNKSGFSDHIFCVAGKKCAFISNPGGPNYDIIKKENNRLVCAKTYNLCPYNFSVKGGTPYADFYKDGVYDENGAWKPYTLDENNAPPIDCSNKSEIRKNSNQCEIDTDKVNKLKNFCQYYTHCTIVSPSQYSSDYNSFSPYFAKACIDSIGDSQNRSGGIAFGPAFGLGSQTTFSAPIVQCIKETMENIFNNAVGHTKCIDGTLGGADNSCINDSYTAIAGGLKWQKGAKASQSSFFENLQSRLRFSITLIIVISVVFMGAKILLLKVEVTNKKDMLLFVFKVALVIYFVRGDAWKNVFFDGIYNGASQISRIFFKINSIELENAVGGSNVGIKCNFGSLYDNNSILIPTTKRYPPGKQYLMIWDTLDCKIMQYLNYGPEFSSGAIFAMIIASFFTGAIGVTVAFSIFILAFSLIATVIRAMHIFVSSCIAIVIYVFVSPIIIPLILFERTKSIFDSWLSHLISFSLQPIILFSFLGIFISLSEKILYNGAVYKNGNLVCQKHCRNISTQAIEINIETCKSGAGTSYSRIIDPQESTPVCIVNFTEFDNSNGFALLGLAFKVVPNLNSLKMMIILKCALFLYVLLKIVDEIPGITSGLTGQNIDVKGGADGFEMLKKFTTNFRAFQKRAARGGAKYVASSIKDKEDDESDIPQAENKGNAGGQADSASFDNNNNDSNKGSA